MKRAKRLQYRQQRLRWRAARDFHAAIVAEYIFVDPQDMWPPIDPLALFCSEYVKQFAKRVSALSGSRLRQHRLLRTSLHMRLSRTIVSWLGYLTRLQARLMPSYKPWTERATLSDVYRDLVELERRFPKTAYYSRNSCAIRWDSEPITLRDVSLGSFQIEFSPKTLSLRLLALTPNPCHDDATLTHPHISKNVLCMGASESQYETLQRLGRMQEMIMLVDQTLHSYNPDGCYSALATWSLACAACDGSVGENGGGECAYCDSAEEPRLYCSDCLTCCGECHHDVCSDHSQSCATCDKAGCDGCITDACPCSSSRAYCARCRACPMCRSKESSCPACRDTCTACDNVVCDECGYLCDICGQSMCSDCRSPCEICDHVCCHKCIKSGSDWLWCNLCAAREAAKEAERVSTESDEAAGAGETVPGSDAEVYTDSVG